MARLVYAVLASLDGYVCDEAGNFEWAAPSEEVHQAVNELERSVGTLLLGRKLYEIMVVWDNMPGIEQASDAVKEFADIWSSTNKIVYSTTLASVTTSKTRLESHFDPESVRAMATAQDQDVAIGGPTLAAHALRAGIVDEVHLFTIPVLVGGGTSCWPTGVNINLDLVEQNRFADGTLYSHYRARE